MKGVVDQVTKSKSGKAWRVSIGGKWYGAKFDSNIENAVGKPIDFLFDSDAKYGDWIKSWANDAKPTPPTQPEAPTGSKGPYMPVDRYWLNFVSNCCGQAILAGTIKEPAQIKPWAEFAYRAITSLKQGWTPQNPGGEDNGPEF